jgi:hypothetical protein
MDSTSSATSARIRYVEKLVEQVAQQNNSTKMLVNTEVEDIREIMAQQIAEVKQIVIYQEKVYQERIRRLEARVEQLSEFALQLARSSSQTGVVGKIPLDLLAGPGGLAGTVEGHPDDTPAAAADDADDDEEMEPGPDGVLKKYMRKIDAIYLNYTATASQVAHPSMTMTHFCKFLKECRLAGFEQAEPAELLWMAVIRKIQASRGKASKKSQLNVNRKLQISGEKPVKKNDKFVFERLEEIERHEFPAALYHLALEKVGRWQPEATKESTLETFLLRDVFPHTDRALETAHSRLGPMSLTIQDPTVSGQAGNSTGAISIEEYRNDNVKAVIREYISRLKEAFNNATRATQGVADGEFMHINGFVELVRKHDLLPCISKSDLRYIFMVCAQHERSGKPEKFEGTKGECVTTASLPRLVYYLADRVYGDPLFVAQFPTPEARVEKLLAKMFLLTR